MKKQLLAVFLTSVSAFSFAEVEVAPVVVQEVSEVLNKREQEADKCIDFMKVYESLKNDATLTDEQKAALEAEFLQCTHKNHADKIAQNMESVLTQETAAGSQTEASVVQG